MKVEGQSFQEMVSNHITKLRSKDEYRPVASAHEALGILQEEYLEYFESIRPKNPDYENILEELVDIASFCQKAAEDLNLIEERPSSFELEERIDKIGNAILKITSEIMNNVKVMPSKQLGGQSIHIWEIDYVKLKEIRDLILNG